MVREIRQNFYEGASVNNKKEQGDGLKQQETKKKMNVSSAYSAVSKDGDTLEISGVGNTESKTIKVEERVQSKLTEAMLKNCSKEKLKRLLQDGNISRQQYNKIMNGLKSRE